MSIEVLETNLIDALIVVEDALNITDKFGKVIFHEFLDNIPIFSLSEVLDVLYEVRTALVLLKDRFKGSFVVEMVTYG